MTDSEEKIICLIRHGSLPDRATGCLIGHCDMPLSDTGRREAAACGRFLANVKFDTVFAGTLPRVSQTLEEFSNAAGGGVETRAIRDERLNEYDFGDWTGRSVVGLSGADSELYAGWNFGNMPFSFPGGETIAHFAERTRAVWRDICAAKGKSIAVFSHGGVIMSLLADISGNDRSNAFRLWVSRGAFARVNWKSGKGRISAIVRPLEFEG